MVDRSGQANVSLFAWFWRTRMGIALLILGWLIACPAILWVYVFIVSPSDPDRAVMSSESPWVWGGIVIVLAPLILLMARWYQLRPRIAVELRPQKPRRRPATHQESVQYRTVGGIIVAAGAVLLLFTGLHVRNNILPDIERARASAQWPTADGTITMSVVNPGHTAGSRAHVAYEYTVDGVRYRGHDVYMPSIAELTRPVFGRVVLESRSERLANERALATRIRDFPVGRDVSVFYQPGNPAVSVLENDIGPGAMRHYVIMGLAVTALAVAVMLLGRSIWNMARDGVPF